jgi:SAM-dependent methyltransferase
LLDLASGRGELLCIWARDHGITGTGVDISTIGVDMSRERAAEWGVADRVTFVHGDAAGYVAPQPVDVAACIGATWIGRGVLGTVDLLQRSLRPGGMVLVGEPYWRLDPADRTIVEACHAQRREDFFSLPGLIEAILDHGWMWWRWCWPTGTAGTGTRLRIGSSSVAGSTPTRTTNWHRRSARSCGPIR